MQTLHIKSAETRRIDGIRWMHALMRRQTWGDRYCVTSAQYRLIGYRTPRHEWR